MINIRLDGWMEMEMEMERRNIECFVPSLQQPTDSTQTTGIQNKVGGLKLGFTGSRVSVFIAEFWSRSTCHCPLVKIL